MSFESALVFSPDDGSGSCAGSGCLLSPTVCAPRSAWLKATSCVFLFDWGKSNQTAYELQRAASALCSIRVTYPEHTAGPNTTAEPIYNSSVSENHRTSYSSRHRRLTIHGVSLLFAACPLLLIPLLPVVRAAPRTLGRTACAKIRPPSREAIGSKPIVMSTRRKLSTAEAGLPARRPTARLRTVPVPVVPR